MAVDSSSLSCCLLGMMCKWGEGGRGGSLLLTLAALPTGRQSD